LLGTPDTLLVSPSFRTVVSQSDGCHIEYSEYRTQYVKQNASTVRFVNNITEACFEEKVTQKLNIMKESYEQTLSKCFHLHKVINSDVL